MRKCRVCSNEIQDASRICEHCGEDLVHGRKPIAIAPVASQPVPAPPPVLSGRALLAPSEIKAESQVFAGLLVAMALGSAAFGALSLSQATLGVGLLCGGCFLAILARLVQSGVQHRALMRTIATHQ